MSSKNKFAVTTQCDPVELLQWLLNRLHIGLGGTKALKSCTCNGGNKVMCPHTPQRSLIGASEGRCSFRPIAKRPQMIRMFRSMMIVRISSGQLLSSHLVGSSLLQLSLLQLSLPQLYRSPSPSYRSYVAQHNSKGSAHRSRRSSLSCT